MCEGCLVEGVCWGGGGGWDGEKVARRRWCEGCEKEEIGSLRVGGGREEGEKVARVAAGGGLREGGRTEAREKEGEGCEEEMDEKISRKEKETVLKGARGRSGERV